MWMGHILKNICYQAYGFAVLAAYYLRKAYEEIDLGIWIDVMVKFEIKEKYMQK